MSIQICPAITHEDLDAHAEVRAAFRAAGLGPFLGPDVLQVAFGNTNDIDAQNAGFFTDGNGVCNIIDSRLAGRPDIRPGSLAYIDFEPADNTFGLASRSYREAELLAAGQLWAQLRRKTQFKWAWYEPVQCGAGWPVALQATHLANVRSLFKVSRPDWINIVARVTHSVYYGERTEDNQRRRLRDILRRCRSLMLPGMGYEHVCPMLDAFEAGNTRRLHPTDAGIYFDELRKSGCRRVIWWVRGADKDTPTEEEHTVAGHIAAIGDVGPTIAGVLA